ncbi:MAG: hypothetical protein ACRC68_00020 [Clostridium sp.]
MDNETLEKVKLFIENIREVISDIWSKVRKFIEKFRSCIEKYRNKAKYKKRVENRNKLYKKRVAKYGRY